MRGLVVHREASRSTGLLLFIGPADAEPTSGLDRLDFQPKLDPRRVEPGHDQDGEVLIVRTAEFSKTVCSSRRGLRRFKAAGEYSPLAVLLSTSGAGLPPRDERIASCLVEG